MRINEAKELWPIIQAFAEGRPIQYKLKDCKTENWNDITGDYHGFCPLSLQYRIKPEPKYRPFKNQEECWQEMLKHQSFEWVKYQCDFFQIIHVDYNSIGYGSACGTILHSKFEDIFKYSTFADGTPFGIKEEGQ